MKEYKEFIAESWGNLKVFGKEHIEGMLYDTYREVGPTSKVKRIPHEKIRDFIANNKDTLYLIVKRGNGEAPKLFILADDKIETYSRHSNGIDIPTITFLEYAKGKEVYAVYIDKIGQKKIIDRTNAKEKWPFAPSNTPSFKAGYIKKLVDDFNERAVKHLKNEGKSVSYSGGNVVTTSKLVERGLYISRIVKELGPDHYDSWRGYVNEIIKYYKDLYKEIGLK